MINNNLNYLLIRWCASVLQCWLYLAYLPSLLAIPWLSYPTILLELLSINELINDMVMITLLSILPRCKCIVEPNS